jgi:hypothetical protein
MKNLRISDLISEHCITNNEAVVYYEIKFSTSEERKKICDFYDDKLDSEYINAMRNDDDCFFSYNNLNTALQFAEIAFPTKREIVGQYKNELFYVFCSVYDNEGRYVWDNTLE